MKVGFNARYLYDPGLRGFNRYSLCLLRALQELPDVEICLLSEERYPVHVLYRSLLRAEVRNLPAARTLYWEQWVLPRFLKAQNIDIFHAPAEGGLPLRKVCPYFLTYHGVPRLALGSLVGSGELTGVLGDYFDAEFGATHRARGALRNLRSQLSSHLYLRAADLIITVSEFSKLQLVRFLGLSHDKVRVIYEAADISFSEPLSVEYIDHVRISHAIPPRFILFVGGFDKHKNVAGLLASFAALRKAEPDVALVLVGTGGDMQGCRARSEALGLEEGRHVVFLHRLSDRELAALYRSASLFTTLSWHEGFCLPLVEAMASGTPILASSFGAIPEILGEGGWVVDPRRPDEVVARMREILNRDEVADELRAYSLRRSQAYSWQKAAHETLRAYKELSTTCA